MMRSGLYSASNESVLVLLILLTLLAPLSHTHSLLTTHALPLLRSL
jgi:hypothetical protein